MIMALNGFFGGLLYIFSSEILINYNQMTNNLKYSSIYETVSGFGFGITPLVIGLYIDKYMMQIIRGFAMFLLIILVFIAYKIILLIKTNAEEELRLHDEYLPYIILRKSNQTSILKYEPFRFSEIRFNEGVFPPSNQQSTQIIDGFT
jgi:MFS family permease